MEKLKVEEIIEESLVGINRRWTAKEAYKLYTGIIRAAREYPLTLINILHELFTVYSTVARNSIYLIDTFKTIVIKALYINRVPTRESEVINESQIFALFFALNRWDEDYAKRLMHERNASLKKEINEIYGRMVGEWLDAEKKFGL